MKLRWAATLALLLFSVPLAAEREHKGKGKGDGNGEKRGGRVSGPQSVKVEAVQSRLLPASIAVMAPLVGRKHIDVYPKMAGRVASFGPKEGDPVKANQLLLTIDRNDPGETFLSVPINSPISGWVGRWRVLSVGEAVSPQSPVATIVDDSALRATLNLPAVQWLKVKGDTSISVAIEGETRAAKVVSIARAADMQTGRGSVVIEIQNDDHHWRAGVVARVTLGLTPKQRVIVPATALYITESGAHVFLVENDAAKRVPVKFELIDSDHVEILEGLSDGDRLVTLGANLLSPGAPVKVLSEEPK